MKLARGNSDLLFIGPCVDYVWNIHLGAFRILVAGLHIRFGISGTIEMNNLLLFFIIIIIYCPN
jgi:hypothetical protein